MNKKIAKETLVHILRHVLPILLLMMVALPVTDMTVGEHPAMAATSQNVTVGATPAYISISNTPSTWTLNGITGSGLIDSSTTYYANPGGDTVAPSATVVDGECRFTITKTGPVAVDYYVNCSNFVGGDANMTNGNTGSAGATSYGAYSWYSGMTYSGKVIMKSSGSSALKTSDNSTTLKWGAEISTQTNAFTGGSTSTASMTLSAQAS